MPLAAVITDVSTLIAVPLAAVIAYIPALFAVPLAAVITNILTLVTVPLAAVIVFGRSPESVLKGGRLASAFFSVAPRAAVATGFTIPAMMAMMMIMIVMFVLVVVPRTCVTTLAVTVMMMPRFVMA